MIDVLLVAPLLVSIILYKIKVDSPYIKDIISVGYGLFYLIVLLTENDAMHFVYVIPMLCVTSVFHNWKFTLRTSIGVVAIIIAFSVKGLSSGLVNLGDVEIIFAAILLIKLFLILSSNLSEKVYIERLELLNNEQQRDKENVLKIQNIAKEFLDKIDQMDMINW